MKKGLNSKVEHCPVCGKLKNKSRPCKYCGDTRCGEYGPSELETLEALKKHISFGFGVFSILITEYDPDFEKVKHLIEKR